MKKLLIIISLILLLTSCRKAIVEGIESSVYDEDNVQQVKMNNANVPIRSGCSTDAEIVKSAGKDQQYKVLNKVEDWYAVQLPNNQIGFIPQEQCRPVVDESEPVKVPNNVERTPARQKVPQSQYNKEQANTATNPNSPTTPRGTDKATKDSTIRNSEISEDEQLMLDLINQERKANGLNPLSADAEVTSVARVKSQDMIDNNYFSHNSPTYGSPFDMLKSFGVHYVAAGENIAGNQTVEAAHNALMNSPGHRANILKPEYTHIGIGIIDGGQYGKMFTQIFTSKPK